MLQYSHDGGQNWRLVHEPCYQESECNGLHTEGTIYYSGPHGSWQTVVLPVTEGIAMQYVVFLLCCRNIQKLLSWYSKVKI